MPTKSYGNFLKNLDTVNRLCESYDIVRNCRGSKGRAAFDHITRSAILFLASAFEVYIEDVTNESGLQNIRFAPDANKLPHNVRSSLNDYVKREKSPITPLMLCDEGWKNVYKTMLREQTDKLNTPKVLQIKTLFSKYIGMSSQTIDTISNIDKLDEFVSFRGEITHRVRADKYVSIEEVNDKKKLVSDLVIETDKKILEFFKQTYPDKKAPWRNTY